MTIYELRMKKTNKDMTGDKKNEVRAQVNSAAKQGAQKAAAAAKTAAGWKKWLYAALAVILAGVAVFTQTGCAELGITPSGVMQAHEVYHVLTGTECKIRVVENDK